MNFILYVFVINMMLLEKLFDVMAKVFVNFDTLYFEDKFLLLLGSQETYINSLVIYYVSKCFET